MPSLKSPDSEGCPPYTLICAGEECEQDLAADAVQPLPEDQREAGRRQLHPRPQHQAKGQTSQPIRRGYPCPVSQLNSVSDPDLNLIRAQSGLWIWIRNLDPDTGGQK